jgi:bacterioferritin
MIGEDVPEILSCDHKLESFAQGTVKDGIAYCESVRDYVSRDLLQMILDDTEEHIDFSWRPRWSWSTRWDCRTICSR